MVARRIARRLVDPRDLEACLDGSLERRGKGVDVAEVHRVCQVHELRVLVELARHDQRLSAQLFVLRLRGDPSIPKREAAR